MGVGLKRFAGSLPPGVHLSAGFYVDLGTQYLEIYVEPVEKDLAALSIIGLPTTLIIERERKLGPAAWDSPEMLAAIRKFIGHDVGMGRGE